MAVNFVFQPRLTRMKQRTNRVNPSLAFLKSKSSAIFWDVIKYFVHV
jgi:hypothetical protein